MESPTTSFTTTPVNEHQCQERAERTRSLKRTRLFDNYTDGTSDDEVPQKKFMLPQEPIFYTQSILRCYTAKEYEMCLSLINEAMSLPIDHPQYMKVMSSQYKLIQATCWTMIDINVTETFSILEEILKVDPENSFAFYAFGLAQYRGGDFNGCIKSFTKAININPSGAMRRAMVYKAKARSLLNKIYEANFQYELNNYSTALDLLNAAMLIDPEDEKVKKKILGIRDHFLKDLIVRLEADIESELPNKYSEAEKMIKAYQHCEAKKLVEEIYSEEPGSGRACYIKGLLVYMSGSLKEALSLFNEALKLHPTLKSAIEMQHKTKKLQNLVEKSSAKLAAADYPEAIKTLTEALNVDKDNRALNQASYFQRALANFNQGNFEQAFEDYKQYQILKNVIGNPEVLGTIDQADDAQKDEDEPMKVMNGDLKKEAATEVHRFNEQTA